MAKKLTPWFPASVKPVRDGVYETRPEYGKRFFARYEAGAWFLINLSINRAAQESELSLYQGEERHRTTWDWRGLAEKPE